jgi:hypothetical protein
VALRGRVCSVVRATRRRATSRCDASTADVSEMCPRVQRTDNNKVPICRHFSKLSDGLEPSTPSLPWRFRGVTRVHARSLATQFLLQIGPFGGLEMRREPSRVPFLMCPFCVRGPAAR